MLFGVLGPLQVVDDAGAEVAIGSRTQRVVLAALLARAGEVVAAATLIDAVWGDEPPPSARNTLRSQISRLRHVVGERLVAGPDGYALRPKSDEPVDAVDAHAFDLALRRMRTDPGPTSRALLAAELAGWRGDAYGDLADVGVLRAEARRLELARTDAAELIARADLEAGDWGEAIAAAESIVAADPVREPSWEVLVRALAGAGRAADALRASRRATAALAEAGLRPGPELRAAEAAVVADERPAPSPATTLTLARPRPPLTPTIGRAVELAATLAALERARLVSVVGPGGVGKTRLSIDAACARADAHARGSVVVELARVADAVGVASTIAAALDLRPAPGAEQAALAELGSLDALVVLDNCEHVIDAVVDLAPAMLAGGDRLRLLVTSREPLAIDGEHVVALAPLATDGVDAPAVELFRQRAAAVSVSSDGELDGRLVAQLVGRLDGLPLALEMAAARLRTMALAELLASIDRDLDVLASPRRDVEERHRTLRQLLAWSERLLDDESRAALRDLSVFAGPVRATDLPALVRTAHPADTVARLADRSLVLTLPSSGGVRFGLLETVRSYGREQLRAAGDHEAAHRRHAEWFRSTVAELDRQVRTADEAAAINRFVDIFDELRAGVRWALDHDLEVAADIVVRSYLLGRTVLRSEVAAWTADVADRLPRSHPAADRVRSALAGSLSTLGRLDDAARIGEEVVAETDGSPDLLYALEALSDAAIYEGRLDDAIAASRRMLEVATAFGDRFYADMARVGMALPMAYGDDVDGALAVLDGGPTCPAPSIAAWFEYSRGEAILDRDPATALTRLDRAVEQATAVGDRYVTEVALLSSSSLRARTGEVAGAVDRFLALLDHFGAGGDPGHLVTSLRNLVTLLVRLGQYRPAAALHGSVAEHPSSPSYGAEAERLSAAATECREALGDEEFARVSALGRARPLDAAVDAAAAALRTAKATLAARAPAVTSR